MFLFRGNSFAILSSIFSLFIIGQLVITYMSEKGHTEFLKETQFTTAPQFPMALQSTGTKDLTTASLKEEAPRQKEEEKEEMRELKFSDLIFGKHIGLGGINIVAEVSLPDWWWIQQPETKQNSFHITNKTKLMLKIAPLHPEDGDKEIHALRTLNADATLAAKHKILPLVWSATTFDNPFRIVNGSTTTTTSLMDVPDFWPAPFKRKLLQLSTKIAALIVPDLAALGKMNGFPTRKMKLRGLRKFMRSLLSTLDYAHSLGVNNCDLSDGSNVFRDEEGDAIVIDWNSLLYQGEDIYDKGGDFDILPPEALFRTVPVLVEKDTAEVVQKPVKLTSVGSIDIWSAGVMLGAHLFKPCHWIEQDHNNWNKKKFLREIISSIGGNARMRVNDEGDESDLAAMVGLNSSTSFFRFPVCVNKRGGKCMPCKRTKDWLLDDEGDEDLREMAMDLLKKMMVLTPQDRPTAKELLDHPFLDY